MALAFLASILIIALQSQGAPDVSRERYDRLMGDNQAFNLSRLTGMGLPPLADRAGEGRQVAFVDPYFILPPVTLDMVRLKDGRVLMKVLFNGEAQETVELPASVWEDLTAREKAVSPFSPPPLGYKAWAEAITRNAKLPPTPPPPICHGWFV